MEQWTDGLPEGMARELVVAREPVLCHHFCDKCRTFLKVWTLNFADFSHNDGSPHIS
jgi:hypothetical protein